MIAITVSQLRQICPDLPEPRAAEFVPAINEAMAWRNINTKARAAAFLAQAAHESGQFRYLVENLNYSAEALRRTWPSRFTEAQALAMQRQPERIANHVYSSRIGNGPESSGDGWRFRGRGIFQLTGRTNYANCSIALYANAATLLAEPELLEKPLPACKSAAWFWQSRGLNELADAGDFRAITQKINGGQHGAQERAAFLYRADEALA